MKIAFDWDGTLEYEHIQKIAKELIDLGHDVHIVTTRWDEENKHKYAARNPYIKVDTIHDELYEVAKKLNIPYHFTNMVYKAAFLKENEFEMLIDDNWEESKGLDRSIQFVPENVLWSIWKDEKEKNDFINNL